MRTPFLAVAVMAVLGSTGAIADDTMSLNQFPHRVEPVLVQVNAQGRVTSASPAYQLTPKLNRLLRANLDGMIRKPAVDKHGKPIPSQFIMNMAVRTEPRTDGNYDAWFAYVSTKPVPPGSWYWVHLDGDRLALASQDMRFRGMRPSLPVQHYYHDGYRATYKGSSQPVPAMAPAPAVQSMPGNAFNPPPRTR